MSTHMSTHKSTHIPAQTSVYTQVLVTEFAPLGSLHAVLEGMADDDQQASRCTHVMAYIVMAYIVMANIVIVLIVLAYTMTSMLHSCLYTCL